MGLKWALRLLLGTVLLGCTKGTVQTSALEVQNGTALYATEGREFKVRFQALYHSSYADLEAAKSADFTSHILRTTKHLFGPLTIRQLGGIQKGEKIQVLIDQAYLADDQVVIPYQYEGTWILHPSAFTEGSLKLPIPFSEESLRSEDWKRCTDNTDEEHSDWSLMWYYWDPSRSGCDHQVGVNFQLPEIEVSDETVQTSLSYPEYKRLIRLENGIPTMAMTFAFGYANDAENPNPFLDSDYGMYEFRKFYTQAKTQLLFLGFVEKPLLQSDITEGSTVIGSQFTGMKNGVQVRVTMVAAAGVDQMDIFAHSFAQKHEGFFGWFGHSRVGSGFDADTLRRKLQYSPESFSISPEYQMVYWAGCNSYSYYTEPFFKMKSQLSPELDPKGTANLDLISNAVASFFHFNAFDAQTMLQALLNWETPTSYQTLIDKVETYADSHGTNVIVNVLGDEDNK